MKNESNPKNTSLPWKDVPKSIWYFLEEDKSKFVFAFIILLLIFFYDFVPVFIVGKMVDFFTTYKEGDSLKVFYFYVIFIGATWIISSFIRLYSKRTLNIIGQSARARARIWGFQRLTEFSLEWHNKENTGNKLQRIFTGSDSINKWMGIFRREILKTIASIAGVVMVFLFLDWRFILLCLIYTVLFLYIEFKFSKKIFLLSQEFNQFNQNAGGVYVESANNMLSIKALGGEGGVIGRVQDRETMSKDISIKKAHASNFKWRALQIINGISLSFFLLLLGNSFMTNIITIGMFLVLFTYFKKLQDALSGITEIHTDIIDLRSDLGSMMPIFKETEFIKTGSDNFPKNWDKIEMKDIVMNYGSGQNGLSKLSITLNKGSKTGVAGLSGSGKSTLAKIILGLYAINSGSFKIGNKNYYDIEHKETLNNITVVLQETELFNLSLRENITMMRPIDEKLLAKAVEISALGEVAKRLPEGLDAKIGEKGYMLSGGERQRLGIARAIYKNSPIVILDEATSSLDSDTESKIMQKLLGEYGQDKTFLIIAHRLGTLRYTDNIIVVKDGQVIEEGNYEKLLADKNSVFSFLNEDKSKMEA